MKKIVRTFYILIVVVMLLGGLRTASAAILSPYIVDEKSPVGFGDSAQLPNYYGLENYVQDYVNGHAHFSFTYTHTEMVNEHREITGLADSDWVALANLYPMFNPPVKFSMAFTPVPINSTVLPPPGP